MTRCSATAALLIATVAWGADDPSVPLANTRQQLQTLRKDQAAEKSGVSQSEVRLELRSLGSPTPGQVDLPAPPTREEPDARKDRETTKNWLLDGYERAERRRFPSSGAAGQREKSPKAEDAPLNPNDPDYFLRVYERQRAETEAKQLEHATPDVGSLKSAGSDPFAPFLKEWLAGSPVRDALKEQYSALDNHGAADDPAATPRPSDGGSSVAVPDLTHAPPANPFVQALGLPTAQQRTPPATLPAHDPVQAPFSAAPNVRSEFELPERPKPDARRALPPVVPDDKKYFPQLKKF